MDLKVVLVRAMLPIVDTDIGLSAGIMRDIRCKLHTLLPHIVALLYRQLFTLQRCLYFLSHILAVDATGRCPFQFRIGRSKFSRTEIDSPPT